MTEACALWATCAWENPAQEWGTMNPKRSSDDESATLGDLLYADRSEMVPEKEWVGLVEAIGAGDQQALRALYNRTHRIVFTLAIRICRSRELAEEVTLDVFHDVWQRSADYRPDGGPVIGWIMMQARSRAIDRVRFEQRKKRVDPHPSDAGAQDGPAPGADLDAEQQRRRLHDALTALTPDERTAIETAFFSELSYAEVAVELDEPLGTIKTRVRSALSKLRKTLGLGGRDE
jgi:RNA polymerase sigma-70 factor (ECF subfamily)